MSKPVPGFLEGNPDATLAALLGDDAPAATPPEAPTPAAPKPPETPAEAPTPPDPLADVFGDDVKPVVEAPKGSKEDSLAHMRRKIEEESKRAKALEQEREELLAAIKERDEKLTRVDLTFDPNFEKEFVTPVATLKADVVNVARRVPGLDPAEVQRIMELPFAEFDAAVAAAKVPGVLKNLMVQNYTKIFDVEDRKAAALQSATAKQSQYAEQRKQEQLAQYKEAVQVRNGTFQTTVRSVIQTDTTGVFKDAKPEDLKTEVLALRSVFDPAPGTAPTAVFARQVQLAQAGIALPRVLNELNAMKAQHAALLAEAKRLNITLKLPVAESKPGAAVVAAEDEVLDPAQLLDAHRRGEMDAGGKFDASSRR